MKLQVVIHVNKEHKDLANYYFNWDEIMREEFDSLDDCVWCSSGVYEVGSDEDAVKSLMRLANKRLKKHGLTDFRIEMIEK